MNNEITDIKITLGRIEEKLDFFKSVVTDHVSEDKERFVSIERDLNRAKGWLVGVAGLGSLTLTVLLWLF